MDEKNAERLFEVEFNGENLLKYAQGLTSTLLTIYSWNITIPGAIALVWCLLWWYLVYDSPVQHPRISDTEKKYILDAIGDKVHQSSKDSKVSSPRSKLSFSRKKDYYCWTWGLAFTSSLFPRPSGQEYEKKKVGVYSCTVALLGACVIYSKLTLRRDWLLFFPILISWPMTFECRIW